MALVNFNVVFSNYSEFQLSSAFAHPSWFELSIICCLACFLIILHLIASSIFGWKRYSYFNMFLLLIIMFLNWFKIVTLIFKQFTLLAWVENSASWFSVSHHKSNQALFHSLYWVSQVCFTKPNCYFHKYTLTRPRQTWTLFFDWCCTCRCVATEGEDSGDCRKFAKYYRSLCPAEWVTYYTSCFCLYCYSSSMHTVSTHYDLYTYPIYHCAFFSFFCYILYYKFYQAI